jgi:signal transduction histidine kinase
MNCELPLNAIVGFVELLRDGFYGDLTPRQVPPVDRIAASATHLRHLVDQVLDIAKIAAGRLEVHSETIVLRPFVLNVASELESLVSEKGLALRSRGCLAAARSHRSDTPASDPDQSDRQRREVHTLGLRQRACPAARRTGGARGANADASRRYGRPVRRGIAREGTS